MEMGKGKRSDERRNKRRFALERELRFKVFENDRVVATGIGQTIDISSSGVAFEAAGLKIGSLVELSISWPALLDQACRMRLIAFGPVVRAGRSIAACTIDRYEFRTQARLDPPAFGSQADDALRRSADPR